MAEIDLEDVAKVYPDGTRAVSDLDLDIGDGEFMVLVGPSGCGKTTALRMVAGLEGISEGTILLAPALPFTAIGVADHLAERKMERQLTRRYS